MHICPLALSCAAIEKDCVRKTQDCTIAEVTQRHIYSSSTPLYSYSTDYSISIIYTYQVLSFEYTGKQRSHCYSECSLNSQHTMTFVCCGCLTIRQSIIMSAYVYFFAHSIRLLESQNRRRFSQSIKPQVVRRGQAGLDGFQQGQFVQAQRGRESHAPASMLRQCRFSIILAAMLCSRPLAEHCVLTSSKEPYLMYSQT